MLISGARQVDADGDPFPGADIPAAAPDPLVSIAEMMLIPELEIPTASPQLLETHIANLEKLDQNDQSVVFHQALYRWFLHASRTLNNAETEMDILDILGKISDMTSDGDAVGAPDVHAEEPSIPDPVDTRTANHAFTSVKTTLCMPVRESQQTNDGHVTDLPYFTCIYAAQAPVLGTVYIGTSTGWVVQYNAVLGTLVRTFTPPHQPDRPPGRVTTCSANSAYLIAGYESGTVVRWTLETGRVKIYTDLCTNPPQGVSSINVLLDGFIAATCTLFLNARKHQRIPYMTSTSVFRLPGATLGDSGQQVLQVRAVSCRSLVFGTSMLIAVCASTSLSIFKLVSTQLECVYTLAYKDLWLDVGAVTGAVLSWQISHSQLVLAFAVDGVVGAICVSASRESKLVFRLHSAQTDAGVPVHISWIGRIVHVQFETGKYELWSADMNRLFRGDDQDPDNSRFLVAIWRSKSILKVKAGTLTILDLLPLSAELSRLEQSEQYNDTLELLKRACQGMPHRFSTDGINLDQLAVEHILKYASVACIVPPEKIAESTRKLLDTCLALDLVDLFLDQVFSIYSETNQTQHFLHEIETSILQGCHILLTPEILHCFFSAFTSLELNSRLEILILTIEITHLDLDDLLRTCLQYGLTCGVVRVYNEAFQDYTTPISLLTERLANRPSPTETDTLIVYISYCLSGQAFPTGLLDENKAEKVAIDVYAYILAEMLPNDMSSDDCTPVPYPLLRILVTMDAKEMLAALAHAFADTRFLDAGHVITRQAVVNALFVIAQTEDLHVQTAIFSFVAQMCKRYSKFLKLDDAILRSICRHFIEVSQGNDECESGIEAILSLGFDLHLAPDVFRTLGLYTIYQKKCVEMSEYGLAMSAFFAKTSLQVGMFNTIRTWMAHAVSAKQMQIKQYLTTNIKECMDISILETTALVDEYWPESHVEIVDELQQETQYQYLKALFRPSPQNIESVYQALFVRFIGLACKHSSEKVAELFEEYHVFDTAFTGIQLLQVCEANANIPGQSWILKRDGRYDQALDLVIGQLDNPQLDPLVIYTEGLAICRKSKTFGVYNRLLRGIWNHVNEPFKLRIVATMCEEAGSSVKLAKAISALGDVSDSGKYVVCMLNLNDQKISTTRGAMQVLSQGTSDQLHAYYAQVAKGDNFQASCNICSKKLLNGSGSENDAEIQVVMFRCRHVFHQECLYEALGLVVGHQIQDTDKIWCVLCGTSSETLYKARKGKHRESIPTPNKELQPDHIFTSEPMVRFINVV